MAIEDISKAIKKYTTKQPSAWSIRAYTTKSTIFNNAELTNDMEDGNLDKVNQHILMTGDTINPFNTGIPDP